MMSLNSVAFTVNNTKHYVIIPEGVILRLHVPQVVECIHRYNTEYLPENMTFTSGANGHVFMNDFQEEVYRIRLSRGSDVPALIMFEGKWYQIEHHT